MKVMRRVCTFLLTLAKKKKSSKSAKRNDECYSELLVLHPKHYSNSNMGLLALITIPIISVALKCYIRYCMPITGHLWSSVWTVVARQGPRKPHEDLYRRDLDSYK